MPAPALALLALFGGPLAPAAAPGGKFALVIGVTNYERMPKLAYCHRDARLMAETLVRLGFPRDNVVVVTDHPKDGPLPPERQRCSQAKLLAAVDDFTRRLERAGPGGVGTVVVHYSGHGGSHDGYHYRPLGAVAGGPATRRNQAYFLPSDARADGDEWHRGAVPVDEVAGRIARFRAGLTLFVIDACRSQSGRDAGLPALGRDASAEFSKGLDNLARAAESQTVILQATGAGCQSYEEDTLCHGLYTFHLCRQLAGADHQGGRGAPLALPSAESRARESVRDFVDFMLAATPAVYKTPQQPTVKSSGEWGGGQTLGEAPEFLHSASGIRFALVPAGKASLGDPAKPAEFVARAPFYLGNCEVTRRQLHAVLPGHDSARPPGHPECDLPATNVTWFEADDFCEELNRRERENRGKLLFRLPGELEWEYACRAGDADDVAAERLAVFQAAAGLSPPPQRAPQMRPALELVPAPLAGRAVPHLPARLPNLWGLYHMTGNVAEWCDGVYQRPEKGRVGRKFLEDARGEVDAPVRGGHHRAPPADCRPASRRPRQAGEADDEVGFRVLCEVAAP